ncbi:hypothetical protein [Nitrospira sp. BLG_1]|uniref:hypothetical protein n=1 Tax=Nitrospira sp. BLG_1 TaxID=3395883 RepID=UPI0039BC50E5
MERCPRCGGLLVGELFEDAKGSDIVQRRSGCRCVNCGYCGFDDEQPQYRTVKLFVPQQYVSRLAERSFVK